MSNSTPFLSIIDRVTKKNLDRFSAWIVIVLAGIYILSFPIHKSALFVVIPVVAAGWFFGIRGGWIAGVAAILLDLLLVNTYQEKIIWGQVMSYEGQHFFLTGHLFTFMAGISIGRLREVIDQYARTANALRASEEHFRSLYENATIGIYSTTPDGRILFANPSLVHMLGYDSFGELAARDLEKEGFEPEYPRSHFQEIMLSKGVVIGYESAWTRRDGSIFFARESAKLIRGAEGTPLRYEGTVEDITERKQAERELQEREMRIRNILESSTDAIITLDPSQCILSFSKSAEQIFGYTAGEIIGQPLDLLLPPQFIERHRQYVNDFAEQPEASRRMEMRREISGIRKGGAEFPAEASISKFNAKDGIILTVFLRDITERKQAEQELNEHTHFLFLLNDMTHAIITAQNVEELTAILTRDISGLLGADGCHITRWDPIKKQAFPIAASDYPTSALQSLTTSALDAEKIVVAGDLEDLSQPGAFAETSAISIPLIYSGNKLGAAIVTFEKRHPFTQEELNRAEQAGNQIALALWNIQQGAELERNLRETQTLANIALALSETERIGLENVLQLIVASAQNLIANARQSVIHLFDEKEGTLASAAVAGFTDTEVGKKKIRPGEGIAGQVILSGETINIADVNTDPRFVKLGTEPTYRSLLVAPVRRGDQRLGTISIQSSLPYAFTPNDIKLLSQLGTQAAIAIENTNLLENTKQALKEASALYRVNKGLVASLEPDDLLQDTVELLQKNFDYRYVQIFVADPESGNFIMRAGSGKIGAQLKAREYQLAPGEGIVGYTAETGSAFFTNNVDDAVSFVRNPLLPETKSELAVPVQVGDTILGLLDIHQAPPKYLSQRDLQLVSAVADQLAVALQKADLYESLQVSLQQEKAIRNQLMQNERLAVMGRLLATVSHELNNPLQAIQNALFLLKEETNISPQGKQDLEIVLAESERMASMIERLRATYRPIQAEDFQPTQINKIVEDVYALTSTHLRHNQISFEFYPDAELPEIPALADQIRQVVLNLLMNAAESMTEGGKISVYTEFLKDADEVLLTVSDTGPGIEPHLLPIVFEAFITSKQSGTGLGLTISYDIVMKHRGRITAENKHDTGATFKVWLPTNNGEIV
jgi:PAS domain S-box-containing protein